MVAPADQPELRRTVESDVSGSLPLRCEATTLSLFESDDDWVWRRTGRFSLGQQ